VKKIGELIECLFERHKMVRRLIVVWICYEIHWTLNLVVPKIETVDGSAVALVSAIIGLLATGIGFYKWTRHSENKGG